MDGPFQGEGGRGKVDEGATDDSCPWGPLPSLQLELGSWQAWKPFTCRGGWKTRSRSPPGAQRPQRPLNLLWSPA